MAEKTNQEKVLKKHTLNALEALRKAKNRKDKIQKEIVINDDDGIPILSFFIEPLTDEQIRRCTEAATRKVKGKEIYDNGRDRTEMIYQATVPDSKGKKIWDNEEFKDELETFKYQDVIDAVLRAGDKVEICRAIQQISGFGENEVVDVDVEDELKN